MMTKPNVMRAVLAALAVLWLAGCQEQLMQTPNLMAGSKEDPFRKVPEAFRSSTAEVLYATDRQPIRDKKGTLRYGYGRSRSLAFGTCQVEIGHNLSWDQLVVQSRTQKRTCSLPLSIREIQELGRFPAVPQFTVDEKGTLEEPPEVAAQNGRMEDELKAFLSSRLAKTPNHNVYIFVHGYNNTFEKAAFVMAEIWHFMGRTGVPIVYTWPAGSSEGALGGYEADRESGQFTIYHLKQFLKTVASCPDVDKIHLVAHSRGADILMTALLELHIACSAAGKDTRSRLKLGNVVLAAADLDLDVTSQRFGTERLLLAPERITVYMSQSDRAIGLVDILYASVRRIGRLRSSDLRPQGLDALKDMRQLQFINVRVKTDFIGHVYFYSSPAVSSDLILLLRDSRGPGDENGRPLIKREDGFWEIRDDYLQEPGR